MSYSSFGYALPAAPIGGGSVGSQQFLHSSRLTSFATNNTTSNSNSNNCNTLNNTDNGGSLLSVPCRLQLQVSEGRPTVYGGLQGASDGAAPATGLYGPGLINYPRPVHGGTLTDSVYRSAYAAAAAAAHQGYGPLTAAVDTAAVCYPSMNADGHEAWRRAPQTTSGCWPYDFNLAVYPYTNSYGGLDVRRKNATRESTSTLKAWLYEHIKNPYPTKGEKIMLAIITKMTLTQVSTWFANARRRLKKENKMQWSPNKRTEEWEGEDDDDNDDKNNDDDDEERLRSKVADDVSQQPLRKLARNNTLQEGRTPAEPIKHENIDLCCVAPLRVTSATPSPHPPSVTLNSSSSSSSSPTLTFTLTDLWRLTKDDLPTKPRIWSLVDVATRGMDRSKYGDDAPHLCSPEQRLSSDVVEPQPLRPKFQPWTTDDNEVAATGRYAKPDARSCFAVMRYNQYSSSSSSTASSSSSVSAPPAPAPAPPPPPPPSHGPPFGANIHWPIYGTLTTAGPFSSIGPISLYPDNLYRSQLPVNSSSFKGYDSIDGTEEVRVGSRSDLSGPVAIAGLVLQPASETEEDVDEDAEGGEDKERENSIGDGDSSTEDNSTIP